MAVDVAGLSQDVNVAARGSRRKSDGRFLGRYAACARKTALSEGSPYLRGRNGGGFLRKPLKLPLTKRRSRSVRGLKENLSFFRKLMAAVVSAAMFAAGACTAVTMLVIMMAAAYVCVVNQLLGKISSYGFICSTGDAAQKFNAGVTQGGLSSAADAAADQCFDPVLHQKTS